MKLDSERMAQVFTTLCEIDSPSWFEKDVASFLKKIFAMEFPAAKIIEDGSASSTRSNTGNIIVQLPGDPELEPIFFNCHMDTVEPAKGIKVCREGDLFFSAGDTVLGGDDKAGIAILLEVFRCCNEKDIATPPVDLIFTTCEEVGLLGAKNLDTSLIRAKHGYALDSTGVDVVITGAPAAKRFVVQVTGAAAHAGLHPERGINAIQIAASAIADLDLGRLDEESTANVGIITGGGATNIIPEAVKIEGEVRSHSQTKLDAYLSTICKSFETAAGSWTPNKWSELGNEHGPSVEIKINDEYPIMSLDKSDTVLQRVEKAAAALKREVQFIVAGGGSDANVFNGMELETAIIGIGMDHVHSTDEKIYLTDMVRTAELVLSIVTS